MTACFRFKAENDRLRNAVDLDVAEQLEQVQRERELERRQLQEEIDALRKGGTEKMSSAELQKYSDIQEELERMRSKSEAAEKELAEIRGRSSDKPIVPAKAGGMDEGERERMRLLMRAEKVRCSRALNRVGLICYCRPSRGARPWTSSSLTTAKSLPRRYPVSKCKSWSGMRRWRMPVRLFRLQVRRRDPGRQVGRRLQCTRRVELCGGARLSWRLCIERTLIIHVVNACIVLSSLRKIAGLRLNFEGLR